MKRFLIDAAVGFLFGFLGSSVAWWWHRRFWRKSLRCSENTVREILEKIDKKPNAF